MRDFLKKAALVVAGGVVGVGVHMTGPFKPKPLTSRYHVYNKNTFARSQGAAALDVGDMRDIQTQVKGKIVEHLESINGFVVEGEPNLHANKMPDGWVFEEEVTFHTMQLAGCARITPITCPPSNPPPVDPPPVTPPPVTPPPVTPPPVTPPVAKSWGVQRVHAAEGQSLVDTSTVKVGIVDTGIDLNNPNNGRVVWSQDFTGKGSAQDGHGHGTHVAGTIGGKGGVGVAPGVALYIAKGLTDQGSGSDTNLASALVTICNQGVNIVSNSWGSSQQSSIIAQAIAYCANKGVYVFVANGNDGGAVNYPARQAGSTPNVYAIAASDQNDQITSFSSRGPETRYIAPGLNIVSNAPGGGLATMSGTSMATPHAAAVCAFGVARGHKPCITPEDLHLAPSLEGSGLPRADLSAQ